MSEGSSSLHGFHGHVRLFPLPNLVLFPAVVQPLHVFEPRYRQLTADALAEDRLITMALLRPGFEDDYHKRPPVYPGVCIGQIFKEEKLGDGRYNLLLHGACRARIVEEVAADRPYRVAHVELVHEQPVADAAAEHRLRRQLGKALKLWLTAASAAQEQLDKLLHSALPLGTLCDLFTFALPLDTAVKQELLEEAGVARRVERLLHHLDERAAAGAAGRRFPPEFSPN